MKITPAMLEAGVNAMARIKKQKPQDGAVVNAIFSAMHSAMLTEQRRLAGLETPKPYEHQAWPSWFYGPDGSSCVCKAEDDVPPGWTRSPQPVTQPEPVSILIPKRKYTKRATDGASTEH